MHNHLHIVSFDIPWPADYGGVIDVFYKIKALHDVGIKVHLHCFYKNRKTSDELSMYCESVNYYRRTKKFHPFVPYIASSRESNVLLQNLLKDNYPILLEGIHCTGVLQKHDFKERKIFIRLHNVEWLYYKQLAERESNPIKKWYFSRESKLLKNYEKSTASKAMLLAINKSDSEYYKLNFKAENIKVIPAFLPHHSPEIKEGTGTYCLYHGNLSINENEFAALWLIENVFTHLNIPFYIAGKNPSKKLREIIKKQSRITLFANPSQKQMNDLLKDAQINILPVFNNAGTKLKLLSALFNGRHCIVNDEALKGAQGLGELVHIANAAHEFINAIEKQMQLSFTLSEIDEREKTLSDLFSNSRNALIIKSLIQ